MDNSKFKKQPKPQGKCIFCGGYGLSKEHLLADWMHDHLPEVLDYEHKLVDWSNDPETNERRMTGYKKGRFQRPGDHRARKLRAVCETCNNGWMSQIQDRVKDTLLPLVQDRWSFLTIDQQSKLSAWAMLYTIIWEQAHPERATIDGAERIDFMRSWTPPDGWLIWIGRYSDDSRLRTTHRIINIFPFGDAAPSENSLANTQMTAVAPGSVFIFTFSHTKGIMDTEAFNYLKFLVLNTGLRQIWPPTEGNIFDSPIPAKTLPSGAGPELIEYITERLFSPRPRTIIQKVIT